MLRFIPSFLHRTVEIAKLPESQKFLIGIWGRKTRSVWSNQQHRVLTSHTTPICTYFLIWDFYSMNRPVLWGKINFISECTTIPFQFKWCRKYPGKEINPAFRRDEYYYSLTIGRKDYHMEMPMTPKSRTGSLRSWESPERNDTGDKARYMAQNAPSRHLREGVSDRWTDKRTHPLLEI